MLDFFVIRCYGINDEIEKYFVKNKKTVKEVSFKMKFGQ